MPYRNVSLPDELVTYIETLIDNPTIKKKYAYSSIAEVVRAALTDKIKELEMEIERTRVLEEKNNKKIFDV